MFPEVVPLSAGADAPQSQDVFGAGFRPEHPGLFAAGAHDAFAAGFNHARANEVSVLAERAVLHARHVVFEVMQSLLDVRFARPAPAFLLGGVNDLLHAVFEQQPFPNAQPFLDLWMLLAQEGFEQFFEMFDRVVKIDDLLAAWKVDLAMVFQAAGAIEEQDDFARGAAAAAARFFAQEQAKIGDGAEG